MTRLIVVRRLLALLLAALLAAPHAALAQAPPAGAAAAPDLSEGIWPRQMSINGADVLVYQPQLDSWEGNRLKARAAVAVRRPGAAQPSFGVVWIDARTDVDKASGIVTLRDIAIPKVSFPGAPGRESDMLRVARQHIPAGVKTIPLAQLEANLAISRAEGAQVGAVPVVNTPPRIIVSQTPAVLVRIDGQPTLRQMPGSTLLRAINTRALVLLDSATGWYYLAARGGWMASHALEGPWSAAANPPASLEAAKRTALASPPVDLLETPGGGMAAAPPTVYVSTTPAELIELQGPPTWSPIPGTELLYATNTDAHVFLEMRAQDTYVLISGRWFKSKGLNGPWAYVAGNQLPPDFAKIPESSPAGMVLASVSGTPQAQEAVIANSIPQTATVTRAAATFTATYDGPPQFLPIGGTPLTYAANSPTPIIRVDGKTYYSLYNGVWFVAASPAGPWVVAATVPAVVYTIPVTSPLHYVTYVRVYGATPSVVYVGYTPGYMGTVVAPDGVVVYGTGVVYTPWVGTVWYPPPPTYGTGAAFAWGAATGFVMGAATTAAVWGCCGGSTTYNTNVNVNKTTYNYNGNNVYNSWSKTTVSSGDKSATVYQGPNTKVATNNQNNNVYASHDGNVYKKDDGSWEKWGGSGNGWQPVNTNTSSSSTSSSTQRSSSTSSSSSSTSTSRSSSTSSSTSTSSSQNLGSSQQQRSGSTSSSTGQTPNQQSAQQREQNAQAQRQGGQSTSGSQSLGGTQGGAAGQGQGRFGQQSGQSLGGTQSGQRSGGQQGGFGQRFGGGQGGESFGQRFGGGQGGGMQGLEGDASARDRGFSRFSGSRGGGGFFRR